MNQISDIITSAADGALTIFDKTYSPSDLFRPGACDPLIDRIKTEVKKEVTDPSTEEGRRYIKSLAFKVTKSKTAIEAARVALVSDEKKRLANIDAEGKRIREALEALADEVRQPVTEFEEREKNRIASHEAKLESLKRLGDITNAFGINPLTADIAKRLEEIKAFDVSGFEEFKTIASGTKAELIEGISAHLAASEKADADRAELERLRAEAEERARKDREAEIVAKAKAEAEREKAEAVARAEREKHEAEERATKAEAERKAASERAEQDRIRGHEFSLQSIRGMINDATSPFNDSSKIRYIAGMIESMSEMKRDWQEFSGQFSELVKDGNDRIAERLNIVTADEAERANKAKADQEAESKRREEMAAQRERERLETERQAEAEATAKRERDRAHKAKINGEVLKALMANQTIALTEATAKALIASIAKGEIPHTRISY